MRLAGLQKDMHTLSLVFLFFAYLYAASWMVTIWIAGREVWKSFRDRPGPTGRPVETIVNEAKAHGEVVVF